VAFPLLAPLAQWLARLRTGWLALMLLGATLASIAYAAYLLLSWPKAL
jgi:hypothetical protein